METSAGSARRKGEEDAIHQDARPRGRSRHRRDGVRRRLRGVGDVDVLCTSNAALVCAEANQFVNKLVHFEAKDPVLLGPPDILCESALLSGETLTFRNPLLIHIHELKYSGCSTKVIFKISCNVTAEHLGLLDLLKTAPNLGELTDLELGGAFTQVRVNCGGGTVNCLYDGKELAGHAEGAVEPSTPGKVVYTKQAVHRIEGSGCPEAGLLDATFAELTTSEPLLYIKGSSGSEPGTVLCTSNEGGALTCAAGSNNQYVNKLVHFEATDRNC